MQVTTTVTERVHVVTTTPYVNIKDPHHTDDPIVEIFEGNDEEGSGSGDDWNSDDEDYDYREGSGGARENTFAIFILFLFFSYPTGAKRPILEVGRS